MKIRNGFVSNSSSSSFVLIGFKLRGNQVDKKRFLESRGKEIPQDEDYLDDAFYSELYCTTGVLTDDGEFYVGKIIADGDDFYDTNEIDIESAVVEASKYREIFNIPEDEPVRLYTGERAT